MTEGLRNQRRGDLCPSDDVWVVALRSTGKRVVEYDTREEAEAAVEWYEQTFGADTLEVRHGR